MTMWLLRWWPSMVAVLLCVLLAAVGVAVQLDAVFASFAVFALATLFLFLAVTSKFVPLDLGSYARKMRQHTLVAYAVWRQSRALVGQMQVALQGTAFAAIDQLLADASFCDRLLYRDMDEAEEEFWCAYLRYRTIDDDALIVRDRTVRRLYMFLRARRTTEEGRERLVVREVLGT